MKQRSYVYGLAPLRSLVRTPVRFFIVATPRSGSTLLVSLLESHPDIRCEPEILRKLKPGVPALRFLEARAVLARVRHHSRAYGCKAVTEQVMQLPDRQGVTLISELQQRGFRIIVLTRRDLLAAVVSSKLATRDDKWHFRSGDDVELVPLVIDPIDLLASLERRERHRAFLEAAVENVPHFRLTYEDDLESPLTQQATLDKVCGDFGLPPTEATTSLVRGLSPTVRDRIANYDEVMDALRGSRFAAYAEPSEHNRPS